jgi:FkbM family methyltransferase
LIPFRKPLGHLARMFGYRNRFDLFRSEYLKSLGFQVDTIVDAGVDYGTIPLYRAYADALFVLVDPRRDAPAMLQMKPGRYQYVNKALGASPGHLTFREQEEGKSSLLERTALTRSRVQAEYDVEVTTIDLLLDQIPRPGAIGIKLDTEGYELEIMKGVRKYKEAIEFVICEASIKKRFVGSYQFSELVAYMLEQDLLLFNFLNPPQPQPFFYDVIFVRRDSDLFG